MTPPGVDALVQARTRPLCVRLDRALRVLDVSGDPHHYGYDCLKPGASAADCLPFLVGFGEGGDLDFAFLETPNGRSAEVHWSDAGESGWQLVLLDVSLARDQVREIQAIANESRLMKYRLEQATQRLEESQAALARLAYRDPLTGLHNGRAFHDALARELAQSARARQALSLVLIDVDHFKRYNDHYGHPAGDDCLVAVARHIGDQALRPGDLAARIGGEEFALLLPRTDTPAARLVAERLRASLEQARLPHIEAPLGIVTASVGVASPGDPGSADAGRDLYRAADEALYRAKRGGRNRVET
jgi:diguanylate cyclase (GGDEF)-like protein